MQKVCNNCHSVDLVTTHRQTREQWTTTVQRMAQRGASASDQQFNSIVDYLTENFAPTVGSGPYPEDQLKRSLLLPFLLLDLAVFAQRSSPPAIEYSSVAAFPQASA